MPRHDAQQDRDEAQTIKLFWQHEYSPSFRRRIAAEQVATLERKLVLAKQRLEQLLNKTDEQLHQESQRRLEMDLGRYRELRRVVHSRNKRDELPVIWRITTGAGMEHLAIEFYAETASYLCRSPRKSTPDRPQPYRYYSIKKAHVIHTEDLTRPTT